ncbi:MAG TPA: type I polyketide synthase, partial [Polyangiaceae bacterium]|nr:type I polyketide synthase [Polyangiaceae bacterium]
MKSSDERLLRLLKEARYALEAERKRRTEPIAIVGIGCRFPGGAAGPRAFWKLLEQGVDATCPVPLERWDARALYDPDPNAPGKCYTQRGGFLDQVSGFEPEFFGISPREAAGLDPQQRLLLEVTWEALEDAGIPADRLAGSATGVWVGLSLDDYARRCIPTGHLERIDAYTALGNARSVAAGRIAYVLGLHGPVLQLDTACSSSLVAVHLACQSLRSGECELAIVGGVNVMSSPEASVALCRLQALAPDGRCKTFDAAADGYGRGEGCGVVVLKRLAAARAAGDHIHAVIRGSAVNHDGRSNGLTAPNGAAQEAVLRSALTDAGVDPAHVGYVEAHGTGTLLGDPIEVLALSRVYGAARAPEQPLVLGSVKTNFGHLEAAAGVAALIKTALCLEHGQLAPHLHFHKPNPKIPWAQLPVRVATQNEAFPRGQGGAFAGVSSFGISGTNAHVVLEAVSSIASGPHAVARSAELVVLSARTEPALKALARELSSQLAARPELSLAELAFSSMTARAAMDRRWAFAVSSRAAFEAALEAALAAENAPVTTTDSISRPKVAFIFPGQGSQWPGMGRSLLLEEPVFREAMQACDAAISRETGWSVLTELESGAQFDRIEVVQPLLFAMQVSLAALWRSWGVEPDVVVGHSMGEAAAACVAGSLSLEDGARVICRRSKLLRRISGKGEMALVELSIDEAKAALRGFEDRLGVAVSNARHSTVLSGEPAALASVLATLEARGVFCRRVKVDVASHSPQVDPLLAELVSQLTDLAPVTETIPIYSTVTGRALSGSEQTARYWADNLRKPVRFADAVEGLIEQGFRLFVELSPHPLLLSAIEELRGQAGVAGTAVGSLRREQPERLALLDALGALYTHGMPLQPERLFPNGMIGGKNGLRRIELPTYPWQRENYWLEAPVHLAGSAPESGHPLLGVRVATAAAFAVYETLISEREPGWLVDHRVGGEAVLPAAAILELVRASAEDAHDGLSCEVSELVLASPLVLRAGQTTRLQLVLSRDSDSDALSATLCSQPADAVTGTAWTRHATARAIPVSADVSGAALPKVPVGTLRARCSTSVDVERLHAGFLTGGIQYGSAFRGLRYVSRGEREVIAELELHSSLSAQGYGVHPALLDAALQASAALLPLEATGQAFLPFGCERYRVQRAAADNALVHVELIDASPEHLVVDVTLCEPTGEVIAEIDALHARRADVPRLIERASSSKVTPNRHELYRLSWREAELRGIDTPEKSTAPLSQQRQASRWGIVALGPHSSGDLHESANLHERSNLQRLGEALSDLGAAVDHLDLAALEASAVEHVVCVWDVGEDATAATRAAIQALQIVQALTRRNRPTRLWWITRRVFSELTDGVSEPAVVSPAAATVWGVGRTLRQEHPELNCKLIDCDANEPEFAASVARILNAELAAQDEEDELRYCRGRRYVARLSTVPGHRPSTDSRASVLSASGTVLITGGLGALGLMLARGCAERGARRLLLVGRRGAETPGTTEALAELQRIGAEVEVAAIDIADAASLARLIAAIPAEFPLRGV